MIGRRDFARTLLSVSAGATFGCSASERIRATDAGETAADDGGAVDAGPRCEDGPIPVVIKAKLPPIPIRVYRGAVGGFEATTLCDYLDPDGKKGIAAVAIIASALWCGPCADFADRLPKFVAEYAPRGARFVDLVMQGAIANTDSNQADVDTWIARHPASADVGLADYRSFFAAGKEQWPTTWFVDPRTGIIVSRQSGDPAPTVDTLSKLEAVLVGNGA